MAASWRRSRTILKCMSVRFPLAARMARAEESIEGWGAGYPATRTHGPGARVARGHIRRRRKRLRAGILGHLRFRPVRAGPGTALSIAQAIRGNQDFC